MATLQLEHVKKTYGDKTIVHGIDAAIEDGELIVIVGPSGCGKSTLLRMIAGLEEISEGKISINNTVVNDMEPKHRNIAMVFQNYALYPHMTVYANMAYGLRMRKFSKSDIDSRVNKAAKILELEELLQRKPRELSGGQRQRVAMGRAIVRQPDIFLFDEPLSNLDAKLRVQMRLEIKKLQQEFKTTSVYVTHDQVEAMTMADRLIVLNQGRVEQIGHPMDVYRFPNSMFVAGFIGSPAMNFIKAQISADGMAAEIDQQLSLPFADQRFKPYAGKSITLGIRPENIFTKEKTGADWFEMKVQMVEALGSDTLAYGQLSASGQTLTARLPKKWRANMGDIVTLAVMPNSLHVFDSESGRRLVAEAPQPELVALS